jgi:hypothetical protein
MPKAQASTEEPASSELDTKVVDKKLEETIEAEPAVAEEPATNGTNAEVESEDKPESVAESEDIPTPEVAAKEVEEEVAEPEKPKDPVPTPAITRAPSSSKPTPPAQPTGPPKPLSWASRAAAAVGTTPKPAVPIITPKTSTPPAQPRAAPPSQPKAAQASTPAAATVTPSEKDKENTPGSGWQSVVGEHAKRQNRPQSISSPPEKEGTMGYVRNVTEKVQTEELKSALGAHGKLIYFDVNRQKVSFLSNLILN